MPDSHYEYEFFTRFKAPTTSEKALVKVLFILPFVRGHGVCSLVRKTLLELKSELRSDAFPVTIKLCIISTKPRLLSSQSKHSKWDGQVLAGITRK